IFITKLKKNSSVVVLINNPCLEFWFLIHFKETAKVFPICSGVESELKKQKNFENYQKTEKYYKSSKSDLYLKLKPFQKYAIDRAKKLGKLDFKNISASKAEIYEIFNLQNSN
ncbi:MAG: RloB domain-containing protein, partial [Chlorobi bacterium]|nr:RloB domain-containing protein [Chlorobiota bacterium]